MRRSCAETGSLFSDVDPEELVPARHPHTTTAMPKSVSAARDAPPARAMLNRHSPVSARRLTLAADRGSDSAEYIVAAASYAGHAARLPGNPGLLPSPADLSGTQNTPGQRGGAEEIGEPFGRARTATGAAQTMFRGIECTSKFAVAQLIDKADRTTAWEFLQHMPEAVPLTSVHSILTAKGIEFAEQPSNRKTICSRPMRFDMICEVEPRSRHRLGRPWGCGIDHWLTKPGHPWTNGPVERMNRRNKEATVKRFYYDRRDLLRVHLTGFAAATALRAESGRPADSRPANTSAGSGFQSLTDAS